MQEAGPWETKANDPESWAGRRELAGRPAEMAE